MSGVDLAAVEALCSPQGQALLASLPAYDEPSALALGERLREHHPAALVSAAMTQARLRDRARGKLGADAGRMLFTAAGLEQATRGVVAAHHAARFAAHLPAAAQATVADLCCGIGSDLVALARAGLRVTGVDSDPVTVAVARANVAALGLGGHVEVRCADVTTTDLAGFGGVFCDPARRDAGGRTLAPHTWSPPWPFVRGLLARCPAVGAKVAPGIPHALVPAGVEAEWVSVAGDVVEAALWGGGLATGARRRATLLPGGHQLAGDGSGNAAVGPLRRYLYEPDGAVLRAGLVDAVADVVGGTLIDPTIAYVTSERLLRTPFARPYEVEEALAFQLKRLRAALRARGVGHVVVKKRGSAISPEQLRRDLRLGGGGATATVFLTRVAGAPYALLARPVDTAATG
jgi:SAM-dependent methyltransferase